MRGAELRRRARSGDLTFSRAWGSPQRPGCPAGREPLPDPLAGSRRAVGCCWESPGVLPPQLILGCVQLIMEREGIAASSAFASASTSSPLQPVCAAAGFGGAGARHSLILWVWTEELGEILSTVLFLQSALRGWGSPGKNVISSCLSFPTVAGIGDLCCGISQVACMALSRHFLAGQSFGMPPWDGEQ